MISQVEFVTIEVADQQRARDFYTKVLGFDLVTDAPMGAPDGPRWIEVRPEGGIHEGRAPARRGPHARLRRVRLRHRRYIQATYAELSAKGVEFTAPPKLEAWGSWWAQLKDSEGDELGLGQSTEERQ